jgi:phospholipase/carboxylesterase
MGDETQMLAIGEWKLRIRKPEGKGPHPFLLLLHGWTGDENSMWVFATRLPKHYYLAAPRGIYRTSVSGYGWHPEIDREWPDLEDFNPVLDKLMGLLTAENFPDVDLSSFHAAGFSQGAALTYSLALLHPERISSFASLSGFMPENVEALVSEKPLEGKRAYITHGTRDELVPIKWARKAVELAEEAGAIVVYCEDDVGHKLSAQCFRGMEGFFLNSEQF